MVEFFNAEVERFADEDVDEGESAAKRVERAKAFVNLDPAKFSWDRSDFQRIARGQELSADARSIYSATYRPFHRQHANVARSLNNTVYQLPRVYTTANDRTLAIAITEAGARVPFSALMVDRLPDSKVYIDATQCFPLSTFDAYAESAVDTPDLFMRDQSAGWQSNLSLSAVRSYRELDASIGEEDLFFYVYAVLHSRDYRAAFADDLKKSLPRIPRVDSAESFWAFSRAGRALSDLHVEYESVEPWPDLQITYGAGFDRTSAESYRVEKMRYAKVNDPETNRKVDDKTTVNYNSTISVSGIPLRAHEYQLGSRSAVDWVLNQYQIKKHKDSGIVNDPNDWATEHNDPTYILDLLGRVVTVSMRTLDVIDTLPELDLS